MPRVSPIQNDFSSGEISPRYQARVESPHYKSGLAKCQNWIPMLQGPAVRRSGTAFVSDTKEISNDTPILIPFKFSNTQAYMLEFGNNYIRFYKDYSQIQVMSAAYEVTTVFTTSDLPNIRWCQSNDVLYLVHPNYPPQKLSRISDTNWTIQYIQFQDGPYLDDSQTTLLQTFGPEVTLTPTAATGTASLTTGPACTITGAANNGSGLIRLAVSGGVPAWTAGTLNQIYVSGVTGTTEANGTWQVILVDSTHFDLVGSAFVHAYSSGGAAAPAVFTSTDPSGPTLRLIRVQQGTVWGWGILSAYTNPATAGVIIKSTFTTTGAKAIWQLGLWSATTGYPICTTFYQGRLFFAGGAIAERLDGSESDNFETFSPTVLADGTVTDANAVGFSLNSNDANPIAWMAYNEVGLVVGTSTSEWLVGPSNTANAFSSTNIQAQQSTFYGSANVQALQAGKATVMLQTQGRQLRELIYYYYLNGFRGEDITLVSEHITGSGLTFLAYQRVPVPIIWCIRNDGALIGCTYDREVNDLHIGWHEHVLGGYSFFPFNPPIVKSIAVIPSGDGLREDLWMIVERQIQSVDSPQTVHYIEYLTRPFDQTVLQEDAVCVDCSNTYDMPITVTNITTDSPPVVTAAAHGFSNGDTVILRGLQGLNFSQLNNNIYTVASSTTNTFTLTEATGLSFSFLPFQTSGATVRKRVTTISGLAYLAGETVWAWADGAIQGPFVVDGRIVDDVVSGSIILNEPAATVTIGYVYNSDLQMLRIEGGAADGTALGKTRRINRLKMYFYLTLGVQFGPNFTTMDDVIFRRTSAPNGAGALLFSGIHQEFPEFDYDFENQISIRAGTPAPATLLSVMPQQETQDAG